MSLQVTVVRTTAAVFALYGAAFILAPEALSRLVTGSAPGSPSGLIDMRATYGGMSVAVGCLLFALTPGREARAMGLWGVILLMLGMAGGRLFGMVSDGTPNAMMYAYLALELAMAALAAWALARAPVEE